MPKPTLRLAVLPGDGIGPEVIAQALRVLRAVEAGGDFALELSEFPWGVQHWPCRSKGMWIYGSMPWSASPHWLGRVIIST